ncbi:MAG: OadG family protein [Oscillospiraceae bacterium]|nr:OadG family protein [Oscillospiraceae bacterium]
MDVSNVFVVLMGIGTVFVGLICIIALCAVMSAICRSMGSSAPAVSAPAPKTVPAAPVNTQAANAIPNRQAMIAAIAAAIAEDLGTDVSGIRILSVKQL